MKLKDVNWRKKYPNKLENDQFVFIRKNWGFRLIYDVYLKREDERAFIGTCIVKEVDGCKKTKYVVKELDSQSLFLKKRLKDIEKYFCNIL